MNKKYGLVIAIVLIVAALYFLSEEKNQVLTTDIATDNAQSSLPKAKELASIAGYINTEKFGGDNFKLADYIGDKVILIDFWTYTCINCQRTLPYLKSWHEKYADKGLLIVGVHTPEFEFEKKFENVKKAVDDFGIKYPVVQDNDYATWQAYQNSYWPRKYLIDIRGNIVYNHIGEGAYKETEMKIQELLEERMKALGEEENIDMALTTEIGDTSVANSPETYFGAWRNVNLGNGERARIGVHNFELPANIKPNTLYLSKQWDIQQQFARSAEKDATIVFYYGAKKVFMVARAENTVRVSVLVDGQPAGSRAGKDVVDNVITIHEERLYEIISDKQAGTHVLQLNAEQPGLDVFTFTFG